MGVCTQTPWSVQSGRLVQVEEEGARLEEEDLSGMPVVAEYSE